MKVPPNQTTDVDQFTWSSSKPQEVHWVESRYLGAPDSPDYQNKVNHPLRYHHTHRFDDLVERVRVGSLVLLYKDAPGTFSRGPFYLDRECHRILSDPQHLHEKFPYRRCPDGKSFQSTPHTVDLKNSKGKFCKKVPCFAPLHHGGRFLPTELCSEKGEGKGVYSKIEEGRGQRNGMPAGFLECSAYDRYRDEAEVISY